MHLSISATIVPKKCLSISAIEIQLYPNFVVISFFDVGIGEILRVYFLGIEHSKWAKKV
jgi:hypothetical protein